MLGYRVKVDIAGKGARVYKDIVLEWGLSEGIELGWCVKGARSIKRCRMAQT